MRYSHFLLFIIFIAVIANRISAQDTASENTLPYCTIESIDGMLPPTATFPTNRSTSLISGRIPLLPVPVNRSINPAFFPTIPANSLLGIIGRADPSFGDWLFVELRIPEQIFQYGFVQLEYTTFSGDIELLNIIPIQLCQTPGSEGTPISTPAPSIQFISRAVDRFFVSLPNDWVFYDATVEGNPHPGLAEILDNPPKVSGLSTNIIFLSAPSNDEDVRHSSIFYVATFTDRFVQITENSSNDTSILAQDLARGIPELENWANNDETIELVEARVVDINSYPFLFSHYIHPNILTETMLEENDIPDFLNILDMYVLVTFKDGQWYMIMLVGLRSGSQLHQTILSSIFAQ